MQIDLVAESFRFLVLGMGGVYSFLILMIFLLKIQSKIVKKFTSINETILPAQLKCVNGIKDDIVLAAVISAAITEHKKQTRE